MMHNCIYTCYKCCTNTATLAMNDASGAAAIACLEDGDENQERAEPRERPRGEQQRLAHYARSERLRDL